MEGQLNRSVSPNEELKNGDPRNELVFQNKEVQSGDKKKFIKLEESKEFNSPVKHESLK